MGFSQAAAPARRETSLPASAGFAPRESQFATLQRLAAQRGQLPGMSEDVVMPGSGEPGSAGNAMGQDGFMPATILAGLMAKNSPARYIGGLSVTYRATHMRFLKTQEALEKFRSYESETEFNTGEPLYNTAAEGYGMARQQYEMAKEAFEAAQAELGGAMIGAAGSGAYRPEALEYYGEVGRNPSLLDAAGAVADNHRLMQATKEWRRDLVAAVGPGAVSIPDYPHLQSRNIADLYCPTI